MGLPVLRTRRLILRPWTKADAAALHELWTTPEVRRYLWDDVVIERDTVEQVIASHLATSHEHGIGYWALHGSNETEPMTGFCGFRFIEASPEIELLYGLRGEHWGKGLATEASLAALEHLWRSTGFQRVYARTDAPNAKSVQVMRRLSMTHESTSANLITYVLPRPLG